MTRPTERRPETPSRADRLSAPKRALLARRLQGSAPGQLQLPRLVRRPEDPPARLSLAQEQLWYLSHLAPGNPVYNESVTIRKDGPFDHRAFVLAFNEIVRRHEAWRTSFVLRDTEPVQRVSDPPTIDLPLYDLSDRSRAEAEHEAASLAAADALVPYDLANGPLIRPRLVRFADDHHRLYLALHHLVFDGFSLNRIVLPELVALYDAFSAGSDYPLSEPVLRYGDYAEWERQWMAGPVATARLDHWRRRLADVPTLDLPLDNPRPLTQRFRGRVESFSIPAETAEDLRLLAASLRVTFFQVLAAAFAVLLHRYSRQDEVVFASPCDMRQRPELQSVVGMGLTPLVLRGNLAGDPSFVEVVRQMRSEVIEALSNAVPFASVVRAVQPERDPRMNPLFQAVLVLQPATVTPDPTWSVHQMDGEVGNAIGTAKFDLDLELDERPEGHLDALLFLDADVFEAGTGERMAGHLLTLLNSVAEEPTQRVSALRLLTEQELHRQLVEWNATEAAPPPVTTIHELISAQVMRTPQAVALECENRRLSYEELEAAAGVVARRLRAAGVVRGDVVALQCHRGLGWPIGMLGVLKAGAAYLPLEPALPASRRAFMVRDAGAAVLLCGHGMLEALPELAAEEVVRIPLEASGSDDSLPRLAGSDPRAAEREPDRASSGEDVAYVLYTSGSSGAPKGVRVRHDGVLNVLSSFTRQPGLTARDTVLAAASFGFDMTVVDLWLPLSVGARLVVAADDAVGDGQRLLGLIERAGVTYLAATPTVWQLLVDAGWRGRDDFVAVTGGEAFTEDLANALASRSAALWTGYGPTEASVYATLERFEQGGRVTIGRPVANTRTYVLDRFGHPVPVGVPGELYLAGIGVSEGYVNRPEETASRFSEDPFRPGGRMYRTGDLVRQLADGRFEYLSRLDDQVKLRGFRIELGEIESALRAHPGVASAVVRKLDDGSPLGPRLVAYVVPRASMPSHRELRQRLRSNLPEYMVPSAFVELAELPRTPNGKLDEGRLPAAFSRPTPSPPAPTPSAEGSSLARGPFEDQLLGIWREVLGLQHVGLDDDFFELGGHSLLALRLVALASTRLDVEVSVSLLFERGGTVRSMAAAIEEAASRGERTLVPDQEHSRAGARNLFFVVPWEPPLVALRHLRPVLAPEHSVVGLLAGHSGEPFDSAKGVEERAASMLSLILRIQDQGPYLLAGFSFGGLIAYEVATQLHEAGQQVAWLGLVNTWAGSAATKQSNAPVKLARALALGPRAAVAAVRRQAGRSSSVPRGDLIDSTGGFDDAGAAALRLGYAPRPNGLTLDLFVSARDAISHGRSLGWNRSHSDLVRLHLIPGEHPVLLDPSNANVLAREIRQSLDAIR